MNCTLMRINARFGVSDARVYKVLGCKEGRPECPPIDANHAAQHDVPTSSVMISKSRKREHKYVQTRTLNRRHSAIAALEREVRSSAALLTGSPRGFGVVVEKASLSCEQFTNFGNVVLFQSRSNAVTEHMMQLLWAMVHVHQVFPY